MRWFGRKATREAGRPFLLRMPWGAAGFAAPEGVPRSYEAQVREAYLSNAVAQRCVRLVAEAVGSVTVDVSVGDGPPPPLAAGERSPSPSRVGLVTAGLLETVATQLLLHGNAFVQVGLGADGEPVRLFPLRPERVKVEAGADGWPAGYRYKAGQAERVYAADAVIHLRGQHPLDDHYGLGCLGAAAAAVALHNAASRWNKALLDNAARPSGALVYDPGDGTVLSSAQFERLRAEMEAQFMGPAMPGGRCCSRAGLNGRR